MTAPDILEVLDAKLLHGRVKVGARNHNMAGKPYRPSCGTEGMAFDEAWCDLCARDAEWRYDEQNGDPCQILSDTFIYSITDAQYPKEWVYDRNGRPSCTAFTEDPSRPLRCDRTLDMFSLEPHADEMRRIIYGDKE